jgi:hypothetical protein
VGAEAVRADANGAAGAAAAPAGLPCRPREQQHWGGDPGEVPKRYKRFYSGPDDPSKKKGRVGSNGILGRSATGERKLWLMNGTAMSSEISLGTVSTDWSIEN